MAKDSYLKPSYIPDDLEPVIPVGTAIPELTGVAYTMECYKDHGQFNNFRYLTLFVVAGQIVHVERSQPHAKFEVIDIVDHRMHASAMNLDSRWRDGAFIGMGGEHMTALINRLKRENPDLLPIIAPALGLDPVGILK